MRLLYLREFTVCAKYMNMRRAAAEIHIGQSNLSKHMKQLEEEVGCKLLSYDDNKLTLTEAGAHFLIGAQALIAMYDRLKVSCDAIGASESTYPPPQVTIQQHSMIDKGVYEYYNLIDQLKQEYPDLRIFFSKGSRRYFVSELRAGNIDMCLDYSYGDLDDIRADYNEKGLVARYLTSEPLVVWCHRSHRLNKPAISVYDLKDVPVMSPTDASVPLRNVARVLCQSHGFDLKPFTVATTNQAEYLTSRFPDAVYLYPQSFTESLLLKAHRDMVATPFKEEVLTHSFALSYPSQNPFSERLINFLEQ